MRKLPILLFVLYATITICGCDWDDSPPDPIGTPIPETNPKVADRYAGRHDGVITLTTATHHHDSIIDTLSACPTVFGDHTDMHMYFKIPISVFASIFIDNEEKTVINESTDSIDVAVKYSITRWESSIINYILYECVFKDSIVNYVTSLNHRSYSISFNISNRSGYFRYDFGLASFVEGLSFDKVCIKKDDEELEKALNKYIVLFGDWIKSPGELGLR